MRKHRVDLGLGLPRLGDARVRLSLGAQRAGGGAAFDPLSLFDGGSPGAAVDFSTADHLRQQTDGTGSVGPGDPVRWILDPISGQPLTLQSGQPRTWEVDSFGGHLSDGDGVYRSSAVTAELIDLRTSTGVTLVVGCEPYTAPPGDAGHPASFNQTGGTSSSSGSLMVQAPSSSDVLWARLRGSSGSTSSIVASPGHLVAPFPAVLTVTADFPSQSLALRCNGEVFASSADVIGAAATMQRWPLTIGGASDLSAPFRGKIRFVLLIGESLAPGPLGQLEGYARRITGAVFRPPVADTYDLRSLTLTDKKLETIEHTIENPRQFDFTPDGGRMMLHSRGGERVVTWDLGTPGEIDTATHVGNWSVAGFISTGEQAESVGHGIYIRPDTADRVWLWNRRECWQFDLSTPGDITTAVQSGYKFFGDLPEAGGRVDRGHDVDWRPDGLFFYVEDRDRGMVHQFAAATAWDVESTSHVFSFTIPRHEDVRGLEFRPDGRVMWLLDTSPREVQQYRLGAPWMIETAALEHVLDLNDIDTNPRGFCWSVDGRRLFVGSATSGKIFQFDAP